MTKLNRKSLVHPSDRLDDKVVCQYRINREGDRKWVSDLQISPSLDSREAARLRREILRPYSATRRARLFRQVVAKIKTQKPGSLKRRVRPIYSRRKPTKPGWYWCQNHGDRPGEVWEAIARIDATVTGLICSWMTAPGVVGKMHENDWSRDAFWAGPILPPKDWPND